MKTTPPDWTTERNGPKIDNRQYDKYLKVHSRQGQQKHIHQEFMSFSLHGLKALPFSARCDVILMYNLHGELSHLGWQIAEVNLCQVIIKWPIGKWHTPPLSWVNENRIPCSTCCFGVWWGVLLQFKLSIQCPYTAGYFRPLLHNKPAFHNLSIIYRIKLLPYNL